MVTLYWNCLNMFQIYIAKANCSGIVVYLEFSITSPLEPPYKQYNNLLSEHDPPVDVLAELSN